MARNILRSRVSGGRSFARRGAATLGLVASLALPACSGSHSATALPQAQPAGIDASKLATMTLTLTIPRDSSSSLKRSAKYISTATSSVYLQLTSASAFDTATLTTFNSTAALTTFNLSGCTTSGTTQICTLALQLPPGTDGLKLSAYSGAGATGNVLSQAVLSTTLSEGINNVVSVVFDANAATMTVSASGACSSGVVGGSFGDTGTSPVTFTLGYTDPSGKTVAGPGQPTISIQSNSGGTYSSTNGNVSGTGGTVAFTIDQSAQTFTLTPSSSTVTGATINVKTTPASSSDGLSFSYTKSFTFSTGTALPAHNFLAAIEQTGAASGQVDLYSVSLGGNTPGSDTFVTYAPASLPVTASSNDGSPDVDNPQAILFDSNENLLIANGGGTSTSDKGNFACVPAAAIASGANTATTNETNLDDPLSLAYDARDSSVALANNPASAPDQLQVFTLNGNYAPAPAQRDVVASGLGTFSTVNVPALNPGTYAVSLTDGKETDPMHNTGSSKIEVHAASGALTDIVDGGSPNYSVDVPHGLAWDPMNMQLAIANNSSFHKLLSFYTLAQPPGTATLVKTINTNRRNTLVAASRDGHIAVAGTNGLGNPQVQVYDGTGARTAVGGPIPFNGTTASMGATYIYGDSGSIVVNSLTWLSNTKLLIALQASTSGSNSIKSGLYIFDISNLTVPAGYDDASGSAFAAAPTNTGFVHLTYKPLGTAFVP